jgi:hypothetical protein
MPRETKRRRILINLRGDVKEQEAIEAVAEVVRQGKRCIGAKNKVHYNWVTEFNNGVIVYVNPKYWSNSDTFLVDKPNSNDKKEGYPILWDDTKEEAGVDSIN